MGKKVARHRPTIQSVQKDLRRPDAEICKTPGCHNFIAAWTKQNYCRRCVSA